MNPLSHSRTGSLLPKLVAVTLLVMLFHIPLQQISSLVQERQATREAAESAVADDAGAAQDITGPILSVPYEGGTGKPAERAGVLRLLPDTLKITGNVQSERRYRGIFEVPTYAAKLHFEGTFSPQLLSAAGIEPSRLHWEDSTLSLGIGDPHSIRERVVLHWDDQEAEFQPESKAVIFQERGVHTRLASLAGQHDGVRHFSIDLNVAGSLQLRFLPLGNSTDIELHGDWPHPSFSGHHLPAARTIRADGFDASWSISHFGRDFPQVLGADRSLDELRRVGTQQLFGVRFFVPVDIHSMAVRAVKYASLLLFITFTTLLLFEVCGGAVLHTMHYLFVGCALVLFYLLLLSVGEHVGFRAGYVLSTMLVMGLVGGYGASVLRSRVRAGWLAAELALQYTYFYVLLQEEDYALLSGSLGLTVLLGAVMYLTRNVDWANAADLRRTPRVTPPAPVQEPAL